MMPFFDRLENIQRTVEESLLREVENILSTRSMLPIHYGISAHDQAESIEIFEPRLMDVIVDCQKNHLTIQGLYEQERVSWSLMVRKL